MKATALLTAMLFPAWLAAQQLLVPAVAEVQDELVFNPAFVARNNVRSISGTQMVKREGQPMRERNEKHLYRFDEEGRIIYSNTSFGHPGSGRDTASVGYFYDAKGRLIQRLRNDLTGHFAYEITCDTLGRTTRMTYVRIENTGTDRYHLVPGVRTVISDEEHRYATINDTAWTCTYLNELGLPYREQLFQRDRWGYLRAIDDRYITTGRRGRTTFRYDEKGRLAERTDQADLQRPGLLKHTWRYDAAGNVLAHDLWHDDRLKDHDEYLYEEGSMLLKACITKDEDTGLIHVVRYTTERR